MGLAQINLVVADMNAAVAFYAKLGVELRVTPDGKYAIVDDSDGHAIGLMTRAPGAH
jgi:catechol 2,3-dioxygenase-like lactoylglutathione lyase family enzyme